MTPASIISKVKVYNALSARLFDELYGESSEAAYPVSKQEKELVDQFWEEFNEYRQDREPGEEYELIQNWADDLELSMFFKLQGEVVKNYGGDESDSGKSVEMDEASVGLNQEVVKHMVEALAYFKDKDISKVEAVAFETAMKAKGGINQNQHGIMLESIPGTDFSGIMLISYYYVSWALFKPDFVGELGLHYEKEFAAASSISAT
ncbi:hypothetical protein [Aquiflexum lacus]|uniref:hypothetical protein n=1 Tax=Aquiflexum lacus TaxID=2483805 RepID=UPI0018958033|nr:hypothetical protein [Aquiflexum lacus]